MNLTSALEGALTLALGVLTDSGKSAFVAEKIRENDFLKNAVY